MGVTVDKLLAKPLLHSHTEDDITGFDDIPNILVDTEANILASTATSGNLAYSTDERLFYVANGSEWITDGITLYESDEDLHAGPYNTGMLGTHSKHGIYLDAIIEKALTNVVFTKGTKEQTGVPRMSGETFQIFANSQWNDIVTNLRLREADDGYELEVRPVGLNFWLDVMSGNSNEVGFNGIPLIQQYKGIAGPYPIRIQVSGGTF